MHRLSFLVVMGVIGCLCGGVLLAQPGLPAAPPDKAVIIVRVPADAIVTFRGGDQAEKQTNQKGPQRSFITPTLQPGFIYSFAIMARWVDKDGTRSVQRAVEFQPGQSKLVDLTKPEPGDKVPLSVGKAPEKVPETKPEKKIEKKVEPIKPESEPKLPARAPEAKTRSFLFTYAARIKDLPAGTRARVWIPMATSNDQQEVTIADRKLGEPQITRDKQYGNTIAYFEAKANDNGLIPFEVTYKVKRREVHTDVKGNLYLLPGRDEKLDRYLQPDEKVPISGKPLDLLKENLKGGGLPQDQFAAAKVMYDIVNRHMTYKKNGIGWGQGDALWACDSRFGNCSDFHSLFISMARGSKIASKFEMGFPIPPKRGGGPIAGYHCWAWFLPDHKGWVPVDISEANQHPDLAQYYFGNLSENRVSFSVGRDINLEPRQKGPPLNFFIYPYVEVEGKAYPDDKVVRAFSFKDLP
jgi:uncharacterized protein (TIGR03000 family)